MTRSTTTTQRKKHKLVMKVLHNSTRLHYLHVDTRQPCLRMVNCELTYQHLLSSSATNRTSWKSSFLRKHSLPAFSGSMPSTGLLTWPLWASVCVVDSKYRTGISISIFIALVSLGSISFPDNLSPPFFFLWISLNWVASQGVKNIYPAAVCCCLGYRMSYAEW